MYFRHAANDELFHDIMAGAWRNSNEDEHMRPAPNSPPPPTYESAVAATERNDLMKRLRTFLGISPHHDTAIFSPRSSMEVEDDCDDLSGLPTYQEALMMQ